MSKKYWETETGVTTATNSNVLTLYRGAMRLAVSKKPYVDDNGAENMGKTVTLNINGFSEADIKTAKALREMFLFILDVLETRIATLESIYGLSEALGEDLI